MQPSGATINTLPAGYRLERLTRKSCTDLALLCKTVSGKYISPEYFVNKYNTAYTGLTFMGFIVYDSNNRPVAFNGLQPVYIQYKNERLLAAQNIDIMTDPAHRLKGMFVFLSRCLFDLAKEHNIRLLFGFPNQQSYHGTVNRLGWKQTEHLSLFRIAVKPLWWAALFRKIKPLKAFYKLYRQKVLRRKLVNEHGFQNAAKEDGFAVIDRSPSYLEWKKYNESFVIMAGGARVWVSDRYHLMIGDMEHADEKKIQDVIRDLAALAAKLGIAEVQFHTAPETALHAVWNKRVEPGESYPVLFQDFGSAIPIEKIKFSFADVDIF